MGPSQIFRLRSLGQNLCEVLVGRWALEGGGAEAELAGEAVENYLGV